MQGVIPGLSGNYERTHMAQLNPEETAFVSEVIDHCLPRPTGPDDTLSPKAFSGQYAAWDGGLEILRSDGTSWPLHFDDSTGTFRAKNQNTQPKLRRLARFLNEVLRLGFNAPLRVDMADCRKFGSRGWPQPDRPRICYNRRDQGKNIMLWPLAGYHGLNTGHFAHLDCVPDENYDARIDQIVWRGNLTGVSNFLFPERGETGRATHRILADLIATPRAPDTLAQLKDELLGVNRYRFVTENINNPDCDFRFSLTPKHEAAANTALLQGFCDERRSERWLQSYKYVLSISGYDTGSNFFDAIQSGALVFKETDGWELFYTASFRPWEHYVPVAPGGSDLAEKLEWARNHPAECREMIAAAIQTTRLFANPQLREIYLRTLLETYSATG